VSGPVVAGAPPARSELTGDARAVARRLLNVLVVVGDRAGRIVEVEAYRGADDPASHAHRGPTARNATMFGRPGLLYVYRSYGIHWCANVVAGTEGVAEAVLLRAVEPVAGIDSMRRRRGDRVAERDLANGPGKLCAALGIDGTHDGVDLLDPASPVRLLRDDVRPPSRPLATTRIGITKAVDRPWRYVVPGHPGVSRGRPAGAAASTASGAAPTAPGVRRSRKGSRS
jgi:DNA-3-methyladenine glycosylase